MAAEATSTVVKTEKAIQRTKIHCSVILLCAKSNLFLLRTPITKETTNPFRVCDFGIYYVNVCISAREYYRMPHLCSVADPDPCLSTPCRNDGTCTQKCNGFSCVCASPYYGITCEQSKLSTY